MTEENVLVRTYEVVRGPVALLDETLWERPTPCQDWTVGAVFDHMIGAMQMFTGAAGGDPADERDGTPLERFDRAAGRNVDAWRHQAEEAAVTLPFGTFPAAVARGINQMDSLVHGWDLAAALGVPIDLPDDLAEAALASAHVSVPASRGHVFAAEVTPPTDGLADRLLCFTGRDPSAWLGAIRLGGSLVTLKAAGDPATGQPSVVEIWEREGSGPPLHVHDTHDELWYVLEGTFTFQLGTSRITASTGDVVVGPHGVPHTFRADSARSRLLDIHTPGGFERFFIRAGEPARGLTPSSASPAGAPPALRAAMEDFGARVAGPPIAA